MKVVINGEARDLPADLNLTEALSHFDLPSERVAVEINRAVVRRREWENIKIGDGDKIEVIHFVGGG